MFNRLIISTSLLAATLASPLAAHAATARPLRFARLEYALPRDPLLPANDPLWVKHPTSADVLAPATLAINASVPAGTPAQAAIATLTAAGAHCLAQGTGAVACRYVSVETRDEWVDRVVWRVNLQVAGGQVAGLNVTRDWTRQ